MKKGLLLVAVLLVLAGFAASHKQDPDHNQESPTQPPTKATLSTEQVKPKQETPKGQQEMNWLNTLLSWPEGVGALAVILTLGAIVWQSDETSNAVAASKAQIKTVQDKERARLSVVFPPSERPTLRGISVQDVGSGKDMCFLRVTLQIVNYGETKAFNVRASGFVQIGGYDSGEMVSLKIPNVIGSPNISEPLCIFFGGHASDDCVLITEEEWLDMENGEKPFVVAGIVSYDDVFGNSRKTPFHFEWSVERPAGSLDSYDRWKNFSLPAT